MFIKRLCIVSLFLLLHFPPPSLAQDASGQITVEEFLASLNFQEGKIELPGGIAALNLPETFRYLAPDDTERMLSQGWGNPGGYQTLGMILPAAVNPLGMDGWGVIITYEEDGHVNDDDAETIDYDALLSDMREAMNEANRERQDQGYDALTLVGWAEKPTYDKVSHKLYWAKELASDRASQNTLNYNIRLLGRKGVLVLNAVAGMEQIDTIKAEMQNVVAFSNFTPGNGYTDFNAATDQTAAYGIAALVAGGAAAKMGLFAKLFALLIAFKKLIVLGVIGIGVLLKKLFGRKQETQP
ncbi:DUF2167 domain-containing protein [Methylomonas sp. SURF-2]|uniref:DUF2167 domain-containing protein n=1 Tax=Methylomonas subterranea TaxID=2952225 RepID=A0ABT1TBY0_9GAMM|nr:DUF2167 domain-containing protein [Methylomonas sp. SURF-2]MCQ8102971.1 DUF2167 domain-containing protein [Methylomonas sp. SURF-2]